MFMHELGHSLGLRHGRRRRRDVQAESPQRHELRLPMRATVPQRALDYARYQLPALDEAHLDESVGLNLSAPGALTPGELADLKQHFPDVWSKGASFPSLCRGGTPTPSTARSTGTSTATPSTRAVEQFLRAAYGSGSLAATRRRRASWSVDRRMAAAGLQLPRLAARDDSACRDELAVSPDEGAYEADVDHRRRGSTRPTTARGPNGDQADRDHDGFGDVCDALNTGADLRVYDWRSRRCAPRIRATPSPGRSG